ncbi:rab5 GDP/GTP exchange factor [Melanaphis sacchari]|uniref:Rab5 GDP/GTP exchange factor n=1 Tax=Melanaphis sacchari TaxID=742174 RepID=A0A2H8TKH6_9HEMI|nr:rab5 GDP/GTP exchange factor [Melanaphis sacchari]XP_025194623.1 rab5 GDP/GTP exchange factor [Melanaphis sacchari]XP_025194625.1 rab5 GDP/GTP exchange factor [Melanaphis sacchari]
MMSFKKGNFRIGEAELKCKKSNGCDYYGNPQWDGFCSKCYKDIQKHRRMNASPKKVPINKTSTKQDLKKVGLTEKKSKLSYLKMFNTIKSKDEISEKSKKDYDPLISKKLDQVDQEYLSILSEKKSLRTELKKQIRNFCQMMMMSHLQSPVDIQSELTQHFYQSILDMLNNNYSYEELSQEKKEKILDYTEKYSMIKLYKFLFCMTLADEEEDLAIQKRIRQLNWVNAKHLDCDIDKTNAQIIELVYKAILELLDMDSATAPQDKLACVVRCCRHIFGVLQGGNNGMKGPASADDFLPVLIFVVLKANPVRLKSNLHYVTRFCNASRLMSGEAGYYFTNLCCAVSFIENINAELLSMNTEEFEQYMNGTLVSDTWDSALIICEGMHQMFEQLALLADLKRRNIMIVDDALKLKNEMSNFKNNFMDQFAVLKEVYTIDDCDETNKNIAVSIDDYDPVCSSLSPWTMTPQVIQPAERTRTSSSCTDVDSWDIHSAETVSLHSLDACFNMPQENNEIAGNSLESTINIHPQLDEIQEISIQGWQIPSIPCETGGKEITKSKMNTQ